MALRPLNMDKGAEDSVTEHARVDSRVNSRVGNDGEGGMEG